jgi:beta-lactamase regulating signal transducer with metallopeptidase domain
LWVGIIGLMAAGYVRRRRAAKAKLAQWEREEREMDEIAAAAKARARATVQVENHDAPVMVELTKPVAALPMVEHDGRWHTLH